MVLLPQPKQMELCGEHFRFGSEIEIELDRNCTGADFDAAKLLKNEIENTSSVRVRINKTLRRGTAGVCIRNTGDPGEGYTLAITKNGVELAGGCRGIFWGVQTLRQIVRQSGGVLPGLSIQDAPGFETRGFFHDVTRGKVPTLRTLKELADRLAFYKINQLQLYIEHTFAFRGFSEAWTGKDPLTAEEIMELDAYCRKLHIELVPSIATFGHLYEILVTKSFRRYAELEDCGTKPFAWYERMQHYTLDISNEGSFCMVKSMLDQFMPLFSSDKFNIGCDETFDIGRGRNAARAAEIGTGRLYVDFLKKIIWYLQGYDRKVMFWGDIILKNPEYLKEIPDGVRCLYWSYGPNINEEEIKTISESGIDFSICPGVSGWNVMMNRLDIAYENLSKMIKTGRKYAASGVLNTDWGDFGHINLFASSMPGMAMGAGYSWNPEDTREFAQLAQAYSRIEFGGQASGLVELLNELSHQQPGSWADIVRWRESQLIENENVQRDIDRLEQMDDEQAVRSYRRALEIENVLTLYPAVGRRADMLEYICSARGVALITAACLAIKKYAMGSSDTPLAVACGELAAEIEYWFADYARLWRERSKESELYRIRETLQSLCGFLREHE